MSHGGGGDDETVEPDLTALLDLVMQLLMFFIINVNFVTEQVSADIKLPSSEAARPVDKADPAALFLGQISNTRAFSSRLPPKERERLQNFDSIVLVPTLPPMSLPEARAWLRDKYEFLAKLAPDGKVNTIIYFRADAELDYGEMFKLMDICKVVGFTKIKIRAHIKRPGSH